MAIKSLAFQPGPLFAALGPLAVLAVLADARARTRASPPPRVRRLHRGARMRRPFRETDALGSPK